MERFHLQENQNRARVELVMTNLLSQIQMNSFFRVAEYKLPKTNVQYGRNNV